LPLQLYLYIEFAVQMSVLIYIKNKGLIMEKTTFINTIHSVVVKTIISILILGFEPNFFTISTLVAQETEVSQAVVSPKVGNKLIELQAMVANKNYASPIAQAQSMLTWNNLTPFEKVNIYNFLGFAHVSAEKIDLALGFYEKLLAENAATPAIEQSTLNVMASLYLNIEKPIDALRAIDRLMKIVTPTASLFVMKSQAHYQAKQYKPAAQNMRTALEMEKRLGNKPKENWLLMLRSAYFEDNDYKGMSDSIRELIRYYPKDSYLTQLAGVYSQSGETKKQLAIMEALYEAGIKDDSESAKNIVMLNLVHQIPYRAASILEKEMKAGKIPNSTENLKLLANSWFQARADDKAIPTLKKAAAQSGDPDLYLRLGTTYYNVEDYDNAIAALNTALNSGVKNRKAAQQMLGLCYLTQEKFDDAKRVFTALGGKTGKGYLKFIESEVERLEKLKQEIEVEEVEENEFLKGLTIS